MVSATLGTEGREIGIEDDKRTTIDYGKRLKTERNR
jgi:hypothetical protein